MGAAQRTSGSDSCLKQHEFSEESGISYVVEIVRLMGDARGDKDIAPSAHSYIRAHDRSVFDELAVATFGFAAAYFLGSSTDARF